MGTLSKSQLKARVLEAFRYLERTGKVLVVTDRGRPVLRIQPIQSGRGAADAFGDIRGQVIYHEPVDTPTADEWSET